MQVKFDEVLIPEEKLNRVVAESMDEIYKGCKKKKTYQRFLYRIAALIGIIILSGSLVISNASVLPVLAEKSSFFKKIFEKVQVMIANNKRAPTRHKVVDVYLLTTKLYCSK